MLATTHTLAGGALGTLAGNPLLAFAIGFASHFALDAVPHFDPGIWRLGKREGTANIPMSKRDWQMIWLDGFILAIIALSLWYQGKLTSAVIAGGLGGIAPDLLDNVPFWKYGFRETSFGKYFHHIHAKAHQWENWLSGLIKKKKISPVTSMSLLIASQILLITWLFWIIMSV